MNVGGLYEFVLLIVLVGLIAGVGVLTLDKFEQTDAVSGAASTAINASRDAVADVPEDWMGLIVTMSNKGIYLFAL